ncbi:hypothetical protein TWF696_003057 [Orbilia brochopaga]|uniref:O-methyltransferase domain-containing protein n=1 Tax=Orbilia brochopaga TaxID=3140254 RepID=A0AAV9U1J4_9PEZI
MDDDAAERKLVDVGRLIQKTIDEYVNAEREMRTTGTTCDHDTLPSHALFEARKALLGAVGLLTELVSDPSTRLMEVAAQSMESRALHIVASLRVADIIEEAGSPAGLPPSMEINAIASKVRMDPQKLARIMRCLCSAHVFREASPNVFSNNEISRVLAHNEELRAYLLLCGQFPFSAADHLPRALLDPNDGGSHESTGTAFQHALHTDVTMWSWLYEHVLVRNIINSGCSYPGVFGDELHYFRDNQQTMEFTYVARPEYTTFNLAMVGVAKAEAKSHLVDFPWASLGKAVVVDVGGGAGRFTAALSQRYPELSIVIQDKPGVLKTARRIWRRNNPAAIAEGRAKYIQLDFFRDVPVMAADVYWLQHVLHDWPNGLCIAILKNIKEAMGRRSRLLICEQIMNTTCGDPWLPSAPEPLPPNYGYFTRYSHARDLILMSIVTGVERSPADFMSLIEAAGLHFNRFWKTRSHVGLIEVVIPDSELRIDRCEIPREFVPPPPDPDPRQQDTATAQDTPKDQDLGKKENEVEEKDTTKEQNTMKEQIAAEDQGADALASLSLQDTDENQRTAGQHTPIISIDEEHTDEQQTPIENKHREQDTIEKTPTKKRLVLKRSAEVITAAPSGRPLKGWDVPKQDGTTKEKNFKL